MAGASPYREQDVRRLSASVPASSVDYPLLDAEAGSLVRVLAASFLAGGTATELTLRSLAPDDAESVGVGLLQEDGAGLLLLEDDEELLSELTSSVGADGLLGEGGEALLLEDSESLLLESGAGGSALSPAMTLPADGAVPWPFNPHGWLQTNPDCGLSATTGSGAAVAVILTVAVLSSEIVTAAF